MVGCTFLNLSLPNFGGQLIYFMVFHLRFQKIWKQKAASHKYPGEDRGKAHTCPTPILTCRAWALDVNQVIVSSAHISSPRACCYLSTQFRYCPNNCFQTQGLKLKKLKFSIFSFLEVSTSCLHPSEHLSLFPSQRGKKNEKCEIPAHCKKYPGRAQQECWWQSGWPALLLRGMVPGTQVVFIVHENLGLHRTSSCTELLHQAGWRVGRGAMLWGRTWHTVEKTSIVHIRDGRLGIMRWGIQDFLEWSFHKVYKCLMTMLYNWN